MPTGPQGQKRPKSAFQNGVLVAQIAVGEAEEQYVERPRLRRAVAPSHELPAHDPSEPAVMLHYESDWDDGRYVATCAELGVTGAGYTPEEATANAVAAVEVYLRVVTFQGKLARLLTERGLVPEAVPALEEQHIRVDVGVPVPIPHAVPIA